MQAKIAWIALSALCWSGAFADAPPNDHFTNATVLTGSSVTFTGSLAGATIENNDGGFPCCTSCESRSLSCFDCAQVPGSKGTRSVWYQWTPPVVTSTVYVTNLFLRLLDASQIVRSNMLTVYRATDGAPSGPMLHANAVHVMCFPVADSIHLPGRACEIEVSSNYTYFIQVRGFTDVSFSMQLETRAAPVLLDEPRHVLKRPGETALFTARALWLFTQAVSWHISARYEWWKDGTPMPGENAPILMITNVTAASAGEYQVVARNSTLNGGYIVGAVTSQIARLVVTNSPSSPRLQPAWPRTSSDFSFMVQADPGQAFRIESTTNLNQWRAENIVAFPKPYIPDHPYYPTSVLHQTNASTPLSVVGEADRKFFRVAAYHPAQEQCIANLKAVRHAKDMWAMEFRKSDLDTPSEDELRFYYKDWVRPRCPSGGSYIMEDMRHWPRCTYFGHRLEEPR